jgi:hypothetical protein
MARRPERSGAAVLRIEVVRLIGVRRTEHVRLRTPKRQFAIRGRWKVHGARSRDPRRREEQVDDDPFLRLARRGEADSGQPLQCVVFQRQPEPESSREQARDQCLSACVIDDGGGHIDVSSEARFGSHRDGKSANERPGLPMPIQCLGCPPQHRQEARRAVGASHGPIRRGPSPLSAPGRSCSQRFSRISISSSEASGWRRRIVSRFSATPVAHRSTAVYSRSTSLSAGATESV